MSEKYITYNIDNNIECYYTYKGYTLENLIKDLNIDNYYILKQIHSNKVFDITNIPKNYEGDGLITNKSNIALVTKSKDCNSIFIIDTKNKIIDNIHSGWKGTLKSIITIAINQMKEKYNSASKDIKIVFNPSIRECCFEVDNDVYDLFIKKYKDKSYYKKISNKYHINLVRIIKDDAKKLGIKEENIIDNNICTLCNRKLFNSHRNNDIELNYALIIKR
jgi:YfiH family protein